MRVVPYDYLPGGTYGTCDRCGFKTRLSAMRKEWTGLMVCPDDFDPRPADLDAPNIYPEGIPRPNSRPEPPDTFITTPVTGNDL